MILSLPSSSRWERVAPAAHAFLSRWERVAPAAHAFLYRGSRAPTGDLPVGSA